MRTAIAALIVIVTAGLGPAQAAETVTAGAIGSPSGTLWPFFIGTSKGFFAAAGVTLDLVYVPSTASAIQQLSGGSLDIVASTGLPEPINAIDKGAPIAIARIVAQANPYGLVARPTIKRIEDLKGKTVSLGGTTDITAIYFSRMMHAHGLGKGDYDIIVVGATAARLAGLKSGAVDATLLVPPVLFQAQAAGLVDLGLTIDDTRDLPFAGTRSQPCLGRGASGARPAPACGLRPIRALVPRRRQSRRGDRHTPAGEQAAARQRGRDLRPLSQNRVLRADARGLAHAPGEPHEGADRRR